MLKTVLTGLAVLILGVFLYVGYNSYAARHTSSDEVYTGASVTPQAESRPQASTGLPAMPTTGQASGGTEVTEQGAATAGGVAPPATDTVAANPPNGMTFGGSGRYQLYRQGNLTWRLNTENGETCVIFATEEEWRKPQVYRAGCRGK